MDLLIAVGAIVFLFFFFSCSNKQEQEKVNNQKGLDYLNEGKYSDAIEEFTKNLNSDDKEVLSEAYFNRGSAYDQLKQYENAINDYSKSIEINQEFAKAYYNRCIAYFHTGNYKASIDNYLISIGYGLDSSFSDEMKNTLGNHCRKLGDEAFHSKQYELAIDYYEKMGKIEQVLLTSKIKSNLSTAYFELGNEFFAAKKYYDAITKFKKAYEFNPDLRYNIQISKAYIILAQESEVKEDYQSAFDSYKEALNYASGKIGYIIDRIMQLPSPHPPLEEGYAKSFLKPNDIFDLKYYPSDCLDADKSEDYLLFKIRNGCSNSMDVYYFTKTNQVLLTHLSKFLICFYNRKKILEIFGNLLSEQQLKLNEFNDKEIEDYNIRVEHYNKLLNEYNSDKYYFKEANDKFYGKIKPFAALLPLEELNRYDYSLSPKEEVKLNIQTVPIYIFSDAFELLKSGKVTEGSILLDAIGQIKIAYLVVLLISLEDDIYAREKFSVLQKDLIVYYNFVDEVFNVLKVNRSEIPFNIESRLNQCRLSIGIFNKNSDIYYKYSDIYYKLDRYYKYKAGPSSYFLIGNEPLTDILNEFFGM
jgi:tetratricopeptide (TPR) repeat protein